MKRLLIILTLLLLLALPIAAQDETREPVATQAAAATAEATAPAPVTINIEAPETTAPVAPVPTAPLIDWQTLITGILAVVIVLNQYTNGGVIKTVAAIFKLSDERAKELYEMGVKAGLQQQLNQALKTPELDDDEKVKKLAREAGFDTVKLSDGSYTLVRISAAPAG